MTRRFLVGPAGSGKTWRCLEELRDLLRREPVGPPLLFITPRQSTYQIERQLLEDGGLKAFSRLHIVSFERLGDFLLESWRVATPEALGETGRAMLLRAVCVDLQAKLTAYGSTATRPGFAATISNTLSEFRSREITPARMRALASKQLVGPALAAKLRDLAAIEEGLAARVAALGLSDPSELSRLAAEHLEKMPSKAIFGGVWVDGFAEFAPVEARLLALLAARSERMRVAICLESDFANPPVWHSIWHIPWRGLADLRAAFARHGVDGFEVEPLARGNGRYADVPMLAHLETNFGAPGPAVWDGEADDSLQALECETVEEEAVAAARAIRRHVLSGGRYREIAVMARDLASTQAVLSRVFKRYEIPVFLDRRKPEAHHPLLELVRSILCVITRGWRRRDFIGALKTGLLGLEAGEAHWFEHEALRRGWDRGLWKTWLAADQSTLTEPARTAARLVAGQTRLLFRLEQVTAGPLDGPRFAAALREFLEKSGAAAAVAELDGPAPGTNPNSTFWEAFQAWLEEVSSVFGSTHLPLAQWLDIAGEAFAQFSIGVIPPVLDQVLLGNVDRSRNPDLRMVIVTGCNEGIFPAKPGERTLVTEFDRQILSQEGCPLGKDPRMELSLERFFGYIALTRARQRVVVTYSQRGADGKPLNRSSFLDTLERMFPGLAFAKFDPAAGDMEALHPSELLRAQSSKPPLKTLPAETISALYGNELRGSVSSLEKFAACPYRYFVHAGLKAREREEFEVDQRVRGTFLHEILSGMHDRIIASGRQWRDVGEEEARTMITEVSQKLAPQLMGGLMVATGLDTLDAEVRTKWLGDVAATMVRWTRETKFSPARAEFGFGSEGETRFIVPLGDGRTLSLIGRIDRVDVATTTSGPAVLVIDYKSGANKLDPVLLRHGEQLQLLVYLNVLKEAGVASVDGMAPVGAFYFRLSKASKRVKREAARAKKNEEETATTASYEGVYDLSWAGVLGDGGFALGLKQDGSPKAKSFAPQTRGEFATLLSDARDNLKNFGERIFSGDISIDPSTHKGRIACEHCEFAGVCRVDRWTHSFRRLSMPESPA